MLNFAEQTGSGAVMLVWSFLPATTRTLKHKYTARHKIHTQFTRTIYLTKLSHAQQMQENQGTNTDLTFSLNHNFGLAVPNIHIEHGIHPQYSLLNPLKDGQPCILQPFVFQDQLLVSHVR